MKVVISKKEEIMPMNLENILQIDICNMGENENEQDWNFITFLSRKNNEYNKIAIKLEDIQQLTILESDIQREDKSDSFDCGYHDYAKDISLLVLKGTSARTGVLFYYLTTF
jgi:hypothetical protein